MQDASHDEHVRTGKSILEKVSGMEIQPIVEAMLCNICFEANSPEKAIRRDVLFFPWGE